jgi:hypothetical protein
MAANDCLNNTKLPNYQIPRETPPELNSPIFPNYHHTQTDNVLPHSFLGMEFLFAVFILTFAEQTNI